MPSQRFREIYSQQTCAKKDPEILYCGYIKYDQILATPRRLTLVLPTYLAVQPSSNDHEGSAGAVRGPERRQFFVLELSLCRPRCLQERSA
mmetsp:Transcript_5804/g.11916  ORF Transcript_5804/g.11916 Transcript_5804/m.11916 type:complete len:91 (+) Transcript_5804:2289-2561(+)